MIREEQTDPVWLAFARKELGVREVRGPESNRRIELYHSATKGGEAPDELYWCSSFLCWVMAQCGMPHPASKAARKWLTYGEATSPDRHGAIVVFKRQPRGFHVGLSCGVESHLVFVLGGNQGDAVSIVARPVGDVIAARWPVLP